MVNWFPTLVKYLSFCFFILPLWLFGQMVPPISNFTSDTYQAENQNWDVSQGTDGRMFFANNSGLLEFNGESWRRYPSSNGSILRSVLAHGQRVYSGCYMDFGYWERDDYGLMRYTSLSESLEEPLLEDEQFWNIRSVGDWVLFQSLKRIYAYSISKDRFEVIPSESSRARLFKEQERVHLNENVVRLLSPENVLKRGYTLTLKEGKIVKSVRELALDEELDTRFSDGWIKSKIIKKQKNGN